MTTALTPGQPAPDFTLPVVGPGYAEGATLSLASLRGQRVVLYFYPKDDTPGCTTQACALRDGWAQVQAKALLFGVSVDGVRSHTKFIAKHQLPFPLLSDETQAMVTAYGLWVEKSLYGRKYMGTERSTVIIEADGSIGALLSKVSPAKHLELLLQVLRW
jgi:thioredoxin-dependent peroxiredoxin